MKKYLSQFSFPGAAKYRVCLLLPSVLLIALDQLFKSLAISSLKGEPAVPIIEGVFELLYVENPGAAFSILENQRVFFIVLTSVVMLFLLGVMMSGRYRRHLLLNISFVLVLSGGIGNLIDRCRFGYVVDYLYFKWINFPVFNFADCCLVIGAIAMLFFFFFVYEDTAAITKSRKTAAKENTNDNQIVEDNR